MGQDGRRPRRPYMAGDERVGLRLGQAGEALRERAALVVVGAHQHRHVVVMPGRHRGRGRDRQLGTAVGEQRLVAGAGVEQRLFRQRAQAGRRGRRGRGTPPPWRTPGSRSARWPGLCEAQLPLCMITPRNSPRAGGEVSSAHIDQPPADSPSMVTLAGLPPNAAMLRCTQRSAASWSSRPKLPLAVDAPVPRPGHVEEAERAEPVVDRHDDDVVGRHDERTVVLVAGAGGEPAAVDHDEHREPVPRLAVPVQAGRRVHVEVQAVLVVHPGAVAAGQLRAPAAVGGGLPDALPARRRLGRRPAQRADRRRRVRDAEVLVGALGGLALRAGPGRSVRSARDRRSLPGRRAPARPTRPVPGSPR